MGRSCLLKEQTPNTSEPFRVWFLCPEAETLPGHSDALPTRFILHLGVCQLESLFQETSGYPLLSNCCLAIASELRIFSEEYCITGV